MRYFYDQFEKSYNYQYMIDTHDGAVGNEILLDIPPAEEFRLNIAHFPPGMGATPHTHEWEHAMVITRGRGKMVVAGEEGVIKKGMVIFVPRHALHSITNTGKGELTVIGVHGPPRTAEGWAQLKRAR